MERDQDYLRTETAMGSRASRELKFLVVDVSATAAAATNSRSDKGSSGCRNFNRKIIKGCILKFFS